MTRRTVRHRTLAGAIALAATAATVTATQAPADAEQATERAAVYCPIGYLCLQRATAPGWPLVLVKEGDQREFPGGLKVSAVSNQTTLVYCVISSPSNYGLAPRQEAVREHVVRTVSPSRICPT